MKIANRELIATKIAVVTYGSPVPNHIIYPPSSTLDRIPDRLIENQISQSESVCLESVNCRKLEIIYRSITSLPSIAIFNHELAFVTHLDST